MREVAEETTHSPLESDIVDFMGDRNEEIADTNRDTLAMVREAIKRTSQGEELTPDVFTFIATMGRMASNFRQVREVVESLTDVNHGETAVVLGGQGAVLAIGKAAESPFSLGIRQNISGINSDGSMPHPLYNIGLEAKINFDPVIVRYSNTMLRCYGASMKGEDDLTVISMSSEPEWVKDIKQHNPLRVARITKGNGALKEALDVQRSSDPVLVDDFYRHLIELALPEEL